MKKLSLLVGTVGGAMAGYLLSNKKLRDELSNAKDAEVAAKLLGKHLQKDGKKLAQQLKEFIDSDEVQSNIKHAKAFATRKMEEAKDEFTSLVNEGAAKGAKAAKKGVTRAKKAVKKRR
jgi:hypothetical protein